MKRGHDVECIKVLFEIGSTSINILEFLVQMIELVYVSYFQYWSSRKTKVRGGVFVDSSNNVFNVVFFSRNYRIPYYFVPITVYLTGIDKTPEITDECKFLESFQYL